MDIVVVFKQSYIRNVGLNIRGQCDSGRVTMSMREATIRSYKQLLLVQTLTYQHRMTDHGRDRFLKLYR